MKTTRTLVYFRYHATSSSPHSGQTHNSVQTLSSISIGQASLRKSIMKLHFLHSVMQHTRPFTLHVTMKTASVFNKRRCCQMFLVTMYACDPHTYHQGSPSNIIVVSCSSVYISIIFPADLQVHFPSFLYRQ